MATSRQSKMGFTSTDGQLPLGIRTLSLASIFHENVPQVHQ